jgi:hypothetical protein
MRFVSLRPFSSSWRCFSSSWKDSSWSYWPEMYVQKPQNSSNCFSISFVGILM